LDTAQFITVNDSTVDTVNHIQTQHYRYLPAKVINNSVHKFDNYLTLLAGSKHGVTRGMGVLGPGGVVGIVRDVSRNTSRAFSLLHHQVNVPAKLKRSADQGRVVWKGTDPDFAYLIDIGRHVKLDQGDTIVTSGFSTAFPADVMIGTVENYTVNQGTGFLEIKLRLSSDFGKLQYVYIVENLLSKELLSIEHDSP
jgi:rod shape-determining protein MreC